ncbi:MAG TPA: tetratricopeptide repeat protein [Myxococcota bacterium]|nr:tetratricopeptide repeat protein [Myxococcota bacterium]
MRCLEPAHSEHPTVAGASVHARLPRLARAASASAILMLLAACGCDADGEQRMASARALQQSGRFQASIASLQELLASSPGHPEALYRIGVALSRSGNPSRAIWALEKARESDAFRFLADFELARAQLQLRNFEASIRASDRALASAPDHLEARRVRAQALVGAHQFEAALADSSRLITLDPSDYEALVVHATALAELGRAREAELAHDRIKAVGAASGDPDLAERGCIAPALFAERNLTDLARAEALYADCASRFPAGRIAVSRIAEFYEGNGQPERAVEELKRALERAPDNVWLRTALAARLDQRGRAADAEALLREAFDGSGATAAGVALIDHYRRQGRPERALALIDRIRAERAFDRGELAFVRADLLVDVGELDLAEALARDLADPSRANLIRGRVLLARGNPRAALAALSEGIASWPSNAGARYIAAIAALQLGDSERAMIELRESVRADPAASDAARVLARLCYERRAYDQALAFSAIAQSYSDPDRRLGDHQLDARAWTALGELDRARSAIRQLAATPGHSGVAAGEIGLLERTSHGSQAAAAAVEALDLDVADAENEPALRSLVTDWVALGEPQRALAAIEDALRARPAASLHSLMGAALARVGRAHDASSAFERALAVDSEHPEALGGLAALAAARGDRNAARALFDRAAQRDSGDAGYAFAAAQLELAAGNTRNAELRLRAIVRRHAGHAGARNDLAWLLAIEERELDSALAFAKQASELAADATTLDTLGFVHLQRGEIDAAIGPLEAAIALDADAPSARYHLALALLESGERKRARAELERALAIGDFPEAEDARRKLAVLGAESSAARRARSDD